jgi:hypothetical protein
MKRLAIAIAVALSSTPALAAGAVRGAPYEQTEIDRLAPVFENGPAPETRSVDDMGPAHSRLDLRALGMQEPVLIAQLGGGSYKSDASGGASAASAATGGEPKSAWETDHNFIAPPQ